MPQLKWLIWSNEHKKWWRPNCAGYCDTRKDAGRFLYREAIEIVKDANILHEDQPNEAMLPDVL